MNINADIITAEDLRKLQQLHNPHIIKIIEHYSSVCQPAKITIISDLEKDHNYARQQAAEQKEELTLSTEGHTIHFDGPLDQGRDKEKTKVLVSGGKPISAHINTGDRDESLKEIFELLRGSMEKREMFVAFAVLGPLNSKFSYLALQITDSAYVIHSENLLYRSGYENFKMLNGSGEFLTFIHASGKTINGLSQNVEDKRIYIDLDDQRVFSVNTQYAGNSVGLKKLAFRLTIQKAVHESWLSEHMFIMGVKPQDKNRTTYFTGAFPSASGKTSTAMIPGQTIVGDDLAFIRADANGIPYAANVEHGIFGIIEDVNPIDDPIIYRTLTTPRELIFSNVLVHDNKPFWAGMGLELPKEGINFTGLWREGQTNQQGQPIPPSHKNARYTVRLHDLENADPLAEDPNGVPVSGIIFGGRDPDTMPPVVESFNWDHGVFMGASIESQTTAATIGQVGVKKHDPMAIIDFLSVPLGVYLDNYFAFGSKLSKTPKIFTTNYFLKEGERFLNYKTDKKIWLLWMEGRVHGEYNAITTPIGNIPLYEDLATLFQQIFQKEYMKEDYNRQFAIRTKRLLERLQRVEKFYRGEPGIPQALWEQIEQQRGRLLK